MKDWTTPVVSMSGLLDRLDRGMHRLLIERPNDPIVEAAHRDVHNLAALLSDNPEIAATMIPGDVLCFWLGAEEAQGIRLNRRVAQPSNVDPNMARLLSGAPGKRTRRMKLWQFVIVLIAGGFIGALVDMRTRDYLVELKAVQLGELVDETLAHCDANYDRMREMIARQTSAPCAACRP